MIDLKDDSPSAVAPVLLSGFIHCLLQGIIFCQLVSFWQRRASDSVRLLIFVYVISTICTAQTIYQIYKVWVVTVTEQDWANSPARFIEFPLNNVICTAVQAFLVRRVWKVTGKRWLVLIPLATLLLATFAAGLALSVSVTRFIQNPDTNVRHCHGLRDCIPEFSAWLWGSAILDATTTVALSIYFVRSKTGFHHLDAVVTRILNLTLLTAALPMASMLAAVALFYATGSMHYHIVTALTVISSKLYVNGLLRNLNVRDKLKASMQANSMCRRSIVTVGSAVPFNKCRNSTMTEDMLTDDMSNIHGTAKTEPLEDDGSWKEGQAFEGQSLQSSHADCMDRDVERGDLGIIPSVGAPNHTVKITPGIPTVHQLGRSPRIVTF